MPSPTEFILKSSNNLVVTTLVKDIALDLNKLVLVVEQEGRPAFYGAQRVEHTQTSVTFAFVGSHLMESEYFRYEYHGRTYVTEVYMMEGDVKVPLYVRPK